LQQKLFSENVYIDHVVFLYFPLLRNTRNAQYKMKYNTFLHVFTGYKMLYYTSQITLNHYRTIKYSAFAYSDSETGERGEHIPDILFWRMRSL